jgi:hypothetical protein
LVARSSAGAPAAEAGGEWGDRTGGLSYVVAIIIVAAAACPCHGPNEYGVGSNPNVYWYIIRFWVAGGSGGAGYRWTGAGGGGGSAGFADGRCRRVAVLPGDRGCGGSSASGRFGSRRSARGGRRLRQLRRLLLRLLPSPHGIVVRAGGGGAHASRDHHHFRRHENGSGRGRPGRGAVLRQETGPRPKEERRLAGGGRIVSFVAASLTGDRRHRRLAGRARLRAAGSVAALVAFLVKVHVFVAVVGLARPVRCVRAAARAFPSRHRQQGRREVAGMEVVGRRRVELAVPAVAAGRAPVGRVGRPAPGRRAAPSGGGGVGGARVAARVVAARASAPPRRCAARVGRRRVHPAWVSASAASCPGTRIPRVQRVRVRVRRRVLVLVLQRTMLGMRRRGRFTQRLRMPDRSNDQRHGGKR